MRMIGKSLSLAAASLLWSGAALAQTGTGGAVGGPSDDKPASGAMEAPTRGNTPSTGGGLTTQSGKDTASRSSDTSTSAKSLTGEIAKVDKKDNTVAIKGSDQKLKLDSSTQVMKDGSQASIDDLKEGDQVRASFSGSGSEVTAQRIDIVGKGSTSGHSGMGSGSSSSTSDHSSTGSTSSSSSDKDKSSSGSKSY